MLLLFPCWSLPGWHVLFSSPTRLKANRLIWAISTGRHGCSHLNRVAWTRPTVAWLPAHSGQFVIAVQGAIVHSSTILFHPGQIGNSLNVCFWTSFTLWEEWMWEGRATIKWACKLFWCKRSLVLQGGESGVLILKLNNRFKCCLCCFPCAIYWIVCILLRIMSYPHIKYVCTCIVNRSIQIIMHYLMLAAYLNILFQENQCTGWPNGALIAFVLFPSHCLSLHYTSRVILKAVSVYWHPAIHKSNMITQYVSLKTWTAKQS